MGFEDFHPYLQQVLRDMGIVEPTAIQKLSFPEIRQGHDCLLMAPTGFGKTEAAILPIIDRLMQLSEKKSESRGILVLYITPLRALNRDIYRRIIEIGDKVEVSISVRHGDTTSYERTKQASRPPDILITTPEMLQAILPSKKMGAHLRDVRVVIIDEVHSLVDNKRGLQLSLAIERLKSRIPTTAHLQFIGLSATVGSPDLVANYLAPNHKVAILNTMESKTMHLEVFTAPKTPIDPQKTAKLREIISGSDEVASRFILLLNMLSSDKSTLLFTNTRQMAEILAWRLSQFIQDPRSRDILDHELKISLHHSSLAKEERISTETNLRAGNLNLVISTSSLELGIDIGHIDQVIHYMSPRRVEAMLQRVGRSGHSQSRVSVGKILATSARDALEATIIAKLGLNGIVEPSEVYNCALDVLLHQCVGILLEAETRRLTIQQIHAIVTGAYAYKQLSVALLQEVVNFGIENRLLWENAEEDAPTTYSIRRKAFEYYFENLSTIPDTRSYDVFNIANNSKVGTLDESFVSEIEISVKIILKGEVWKVLAIDEEKLRVQVSPMVDFDAAIPTWQGELIPISPIVAENFQSLYLTKSIADFPADKDSRAIIEEFLTTQPPDLTPSRTELIIESSGSSVAIHSFLGSKGNEALALIISGLTSARNPTGGGVVYKADAYSIIMDLGFQGGNSVKEILTMMQPSHVRHLLDTFLKQSQMFRMHFPHVCRRMGLIHKNAQIRRKAINILLSKYSDSIVGRETLNEIYFEKLDCVAVERFIGAIQHQVMKIKVVLVDNVQSPLALAANESGGETILQGQPTAAILDAVEKRLNRTPVMLHCMNLDCRWTQETTVERLPEDIVCPNCGRRFIAAMDPRAGKISGILQREKDNLDLEPADRKKLDEAKKTADILMTYKKKAAFVLAGRGIGPRKAIQILRMNLNRQELLEEILLQESEFTRTRAFWT